MVPFKDNSKDQCPAPQGDGPSRTQRLAANLKTALKSGEDSAKTALMLAGFGIAARAGYKAYRYLFKEQVKSASVAVVDDLGLVQAVNAVVGDINAMVRTLRPVQLCDVHNRLELEVVTNGKVALHQLRNVFHTGRQIRNLGVLLTTENVGINCLSRTVDWNLYSLLRAAVGTGVVSYEKLDSLARRARTASALDPEILTDTVRFAHENIVLTTLVGQTMRGVAGGAHPDADSFFARLLTMPPDVALLSTAIAEEFGPSD
jgi:hypothetical protein